MDDRFRRYVGLVVLCVAFGLGGCGEDQPTEALAPTQSATASTAPPTVVDSSDVAGAPVLSPESALPIVDNPETEASGNESIGHCDVRNSDNLCIDFTGAAWTPDGARAECMNAPGSSFRAEICPSEGRVGTCIIHPNGDGSLEIVHSFYAPMDPILAEGICPGRFESE